MTALTAYQISHISVNCRQKCKILINCLTSQKRERTSEEETGLTLHTYQRVPLITISSDTAHQILECCPLISVTQSGLMTKGRFPLVTGSYYSKNFLITRLTVLIKFRWILLKSEITREMKVRVRDPQHDLI